MGEIWRQQEAELRAIADLCGDLRIFAVVGGAHRLAEGYQQPLCLLLHRDTSHSLRQEVLVEQRTGRLVLSGHRTDHVIDGYRFGCAICIESTFPEVFQEYANLDVYAVLFSSYGIAECFQIALRAQAGLNCIWIGGATPVQKAAKGRQASSARTGNG
ncbi:hypothetical protein K9B32_05315 [Rhizobium sp. 3T7]|uniref:hypothetical protein n=1 Tax=Rhizobium sp. 3T7 TaxID=2874922 RepID=UPI001CCCC60D|nr:hypothetical protein [Rhizobium sp. 3T7]MBZ9789551.1 hypothetical protein [Rhizobium sp. 3T7]